MNTIELIVISPEKIIFKDYVNMVVLPGENGDFGVLRDHAPLVSILKPGFIQVFCNDQIIQQMFVAGGFAQVQPEQCTVLAEECVMAEHLKQVDLQSQLDELKIKLDLVKSEQDQQNVQQTMVITQLKLELIKRLSSS